MSRTSFEELPAGATFVYQGDICAQEIVDLRSKSGWGTEQRLPIWEACLEQSIATVGTRNLEGLLTSIGFIAGNPRHAVLCDFSVAADHRGQGLGRATLRRRVEIADELEIPYLYTELAPTNVLRPLYEELGFIRSGNEYTRAARRHPSELG